MAKVSSFPPQIALAVSEGQPKNPFRIVECWRGDCLTGFRVQRWNYRHDIWTNSGRKYLTKDGAIGHRTYMESLGEALREEFREVQ